MKKERTVSGVSEKAHTEMILCSRACCVAQDRKVARARHVQTDGAYVRLLLSSLVFLSTCKASGGQGTWAESQNFNQSQELQHIARISQALVVLDPDLDLEDWHPHPELIAVLQRRQDPDTPKGLQSTIAGPPDEPVGQRCLKAVFRYPASDVFNATCSGMDTTVRVCAKDWDEAQRIADEMKPPIKTTHDCEKFYWDFCYSITGPARLPRPFPKFDRVIGGCSSTAHKTSEATRDQAQMSSDALRNYCDPNPDLGQCNTDDHCMNKKDREKAQTEGKWQAYKVLRGCKGYDEFCENIEAKIVRAWEVHGLCTTRCWKSYYRAVQKYSERMMMLWEGPDGGTGCSHAYINHPHVVSCLLTVALATLLSATLTMQPLF